MFSLLSGVAVILASVAQVDGVVCSIVAWRRVSEPV